ncbi:class I SAM-dependent methyltransferase [Acidicapsa dinghuensis]|uniref:Class I SAM-dependent methyltransferase n=1 Tax=Acidicapsa dinghuensis TaxID=2218256 RepID=A0ABW1EGB1_9BACT|nr:class I SAM-dependent methyltransferase [Acidicapsa dinghuensis]
MKVLSENAARTLLNAFNDAGYTEAQVRKHLGAAELPSLQLRNVARLLDRTSTATELNTLLRWFWVGVPVAKANAEKTIPAEMLGLLEQTGLIAEQGENWAATVMLLHTDGFLVAADHPSAIERHEADLVLWPNPTSKFLAKFAIRRHSRATLDLGTGSGILSLQAAAFSDKVIATDLNERAVEMARFNVWLNGIKNVDVVAGDCFAPVAGEKFDLILSNPPFFITPQSDYLFCDNSMELDGLCRRLVKEAPEHLSEGGYLEMLCEWAQVTGERWEDRVAEWLRGTGCDAWVMKGVTQDPEEYAQRRVKEISQDPGGDAEAYAGYMNYYRQRGVEAIHDGLVVIRKREGKNWARIEEVPKTPSGELGEMIVTSFAAQDLLQNADTDEAFLKLRPKLGANVRLEHVCAPKEGRWTTDSLTLRLISGFPFHMAVQPLVAEFLVTCDGTRTAREAIASFAAQVKAPLERVQSECQALLWKLIERGFMTVENS